MSDVLGLSTLKVSKNLPNFVYAYTKLFFPWATYIICKSVADHVRGGSGIWIFLEGGQV